MFQAMLSSARAAALTILTMGSREKEQLAKMPVVTATRANMRNTQPTLDVHYLSASARKAARGKVYPFSSTRQQRRDAKKLIRIDGGIMQLPASLYRNEEEVNYILTGRV